MFVKILTIILLPSVLFTVSKRLGRLIELHHNVGQVLTSFGGVAHRERAGLGGANTRRKSGPRVERVKLSLVTPRTTQTRDPSGMRKTLYFYCRCCCR